MPAVIAVCVQLTVRDRIRTHKPALGIGHPYGNAGPRILHDVAIELIDRIGHYGAGCRDLRRIDTILIAIDENRPLQFLHGPVLLIHKFVCDVLVDRRCIVNLFFDAGLMSFGVFIAYGLDGVDALRDDLAIDHLELGRVDGGGISDRDDLLVCHPGNGVREAVTGCTARRAHRLTCAGRELDAVWIQRKSRTGDGIGHNNVPVRSERFDGCGIVHPVVPYDYRCILGCCNFAGAGDLDFLLDFIGETYHRLSFIEHSAECE